MAVTSNGGDGGNGGNGSNGETNKWAGGGGGGGSGGGAGGNGGTCLIVTSNLTPTSNPLGALTTGHTITDPDDSNNKLTYDTFQATTNGSGNGRNAINGGSGGSAGSNGSGGTGGANGTSGTAGSDGKSRPLSCDNYITQFSITLYLYMNRNIGNYG